MLLQTYFDHIHTCPTVRTILSSVNRDKKSVLEPITFGQRVAQPSHFSVALSGTDISKLSFPPQSGLQLTAT